MAGSGGGRRRGRKRESIGEEVVAVPTKEERWGARV